jgi:hypothetical protein
MRIRSRFPLGPLVLGLLAGACQGKVDPQLASEKASGPVAGQPKADASRSPRGAGPSEASEPSERSPAAQDDPLGQRFVDPPWFRKDLLEGAEVVSTSRSEVDENGFFASHILFALPEGTTTEQCADMVTAQVEPTVPGLQRELELERIKITGATDRYRVILMCGEAKGVMRAYVSLEWFA